MRCYRLCKDEKSIVESCLDKKYSDRVKILKNVRVLCYACWWCYEGVLRIDKASLLETFGNFKDEETCRHFKTRIEEHIKKDSNCHIFKYLYLTIICFDSYISLCFKIIDKAISKFDLKLKKLYVLIGENPT